MGEVENNVYSTWSVINYHAQFYYFAA